MKFILGVILIALLCAVGEHYQPWWIIALVAFVVSLIVGLRAGSSFFMGFLGVALFWLITALMYDIANEHILSTRMAMLFKLPNYGMFIAVTVFIGGLAGGLSALAGALLRPRRQQSAE